MSEAQPRTAAGRARRKTPWRDNIEALIVAIVMAVFLKYFLVEAYKIPTGSMQPTLMGQQFGGTDGVFDRILVDKLSYHFRDPERFEVTVFRYPLDRAKNFVKRLVGMPGEELRIANGDIFTRTDPEERFRPLRRPRPVQRETWKWLDRADPSGAKQWKVEQGPWSAADDDLAGSAPGRALYVGNGGGPIMDRYLDGYAASIARKISPRGDHGTNTVGDLRLEGRVRATADTELVALELTEGARRYRVEIPGPAAGPEARPRLAVLEGGHVQGPQEIVGEPYHLPAGSWIDFGAQNLDDLLELDLEGEIVLGLEVEPTSDQAAYLRLSSEGGGAEFEDLRVARDIYYTPGRSGESGWTIPEGHYFMLGDNTQDSSDSREWTFWNMGWGGEGAPEDLVRGNWRPAGRGVPPLEANPFRGSNMQVAEAEERLTWFRDEWGEGHVFPTGAEVTAGPLESMTAAPTVPRELITGRAVLVFWPISPALKLWRLSWVR